MLHNNSNMKMKMNTTKPDHDEPKIPFNISKDYQDKNVSIIKLNDEMERLVKPLLETCLRFGSHILDLMDDYDVDDVINRNCSNSLTSEDFIENDHIFTDFSNESLYF